MTRRPVISLKQPQAAAVDASPQMPARNMPRQRTVSPGGQPKSPPLLARKPSAPAAPAAPASSAAPELALPHERDETAAFTNPDVDPVMAQAKRDIDAGLVDTDMRATPGLDAALRAKLVPGPGGKPPTAGR